MLFLSPLPQKEEKVYRIGWGAPVGPASDLQDVDTQTLRLRRIAPVGTASKALKAEFLFSIHQC